MNLKATATATSKAVFQFNYTWRVITRHPLMKKHLENHTIDFTAAWKPKPSWLRVVLSGADRFKYWSDHSGRCHFNESWLVQDLRYRPGRYEEHECVCYDSIKVPNDLYARSYDSVDQLPTFCRFKFSFLLMDTHFSAKPIWISLLFF